MSPQQAAVPSADVDAEDELRRYSALTRSAMADHMRAERSDSDRRSDPYLADPMSAYPTRSGKGLRPAIALATCEAFGGAIPDAMPSALALELLHNAFLVHDDIEDESDLRRGEPTLHRLVGLPLAVNAGDGLALSGVGALGRNAELLGPGIAADIYREFDFMARHTVEGQALDIGWRVDNRLDLTPDDYLELIMKKTCWYTTVLPLRVGALIGSSGEADLEPMIEFGFHLGAAFQIRDDVLNLVGDVDLYGKEALGDLREAKRTLILIHLLAVASSSERDFIEHFLADETNRSPDACRVLFEMMTARGSVAFAAEFAAGIAASADDSFADAFATVRATRGAAFIESLIPWMLERTA